MTKREKVLLQICIAIALIGMSSIYLLLPALKDKRAVVEQRESLELQKSDIDNILAVQGIDENLEEQKRIAQENYEFFYGKLNSYTIDQILNEVITSCGVEINSMSIGEYTQIDEKTLYRGENSEEEDDGEQSGLLLGNRVSLVVKGTYAQINKLVDAFKAESTCIEVSSLLMSRDQRNVNDDAVQVTLNLIIYGVNDTFAD